MRIITDDEAIRFVRQSPDTFVCYVGAGASAEAGVKSAWEICEEIRETLVPDSLAEQEKQLRLQDLQWHDDSYRYATCVKKYGNPAARVEYFRRLLHGVQPSFCHHAIAILVANGAFKRTIVTTNFDKLVESAFFQQGLIECQPIRSRREIEYWTTDNSRAYILKLHGDYDTYNIANTIEEIVAIDRPIQERSADMLESAGMLVLGSAGNEKSVHTFFDELAGRSGSPGRVLDFGLLWSVYMGPQKPSRVDTVAVEKQIERNIGREIRNLMNRMEAKNEQFAFFPVWGSGDFLLKLIDASNDKSLRSRARRYLDHEMRLRDVFEAAGMQPEAITRHLANLAAQRQRIDRLAKAVTTPKTICKGEGKANADRYSVVSLVYGDISARRMLDHESFQDLRRGIVSPEDTCISAGGGVAYQLLKKAGPSSILSELAKLQPIEQGSAAVTSGGNLPVEYIFHGAALKIEPDASYVVDTTAVKSTVLSVFEQAEALGVDVIWVPLMGSGVAGFSPKQSLMGILGAIKDYRFKRKMLVNITIYSDDALPRTIAMQALKDALGLSFKFVETQGS